jgi:hypothetical protein
MLQIRRHRAGPFPIGCSRLVDDLVALADDVRKSSKCRGLLVIADVKGCA